MYLLLIFLSFLSLQAAQNSLNLLKKSLDDLSEINTKLKFPGQFGDLKEAYSEKIKEIQTIVESNTSLLKNEEFKILVNNKNFNILHAAIKNGCLKLVEHIVNNQLLNDINTKDEHDKTALYIAVDCKQIEIVQLLLSNGANPHQECGPAKYTILRNVILSSSKDMVQSFVENSRMTEEMINAQDSYGYTPLAYAAANKYMANLDIVEILLNNKANPCLPITQDLNPICQAVSKGKIEILKFFVEKSKYHPVNLNAMYEGKTLLHIAAQAGQIEMMRYLLENGVSAVNMPDDFGCTPLHLAVSNDKLDATRFLIGAGADINAADRKGDTLLHVAANKYNAELVFFLLGKGARFDKKNHLKLMPEDVATYSEVKNILRSTRRLFEVVKNNSASPEEVKKLLRRKACIYAKNCRGETIEELAKKKQNFQIKDILESTKNLLKEAAREDDALDNIEAYLEKGAVVDAFNEAGMTSFHLAAKNNNSKIFRYLLNSGGDPRIKTVAGQTVDNICFYEGKHVLKTFINQLEENKEISQRIMGLTAFLSLITIGCARYEFGQTQKEDETAPSQKTFLEKFCDGLKRKKKTIVCLALTLLSGGTSWHFAHKKV